MNKPLESPPSPPCDADEGGEKRGSSGMVKTRGSNRRRFGGACSGDGRCKHVRPHRLHGKVRSHGHISRNKCAVERTLFVRFESMLGRLLGDDYPDRSGICKDKRK